MSKSLLTKTRGFLGVPQKELADAIGVSQSLLSQIENRKQKPSFCTLKKIDLFLQSKKFEYCNVLDIMRDFY